MDEILFFADHVNGKGRHGLKNITFQLPAGYMMGVIGKNGAGKTTFFDYIMNRRKRYTGNFYLKDMDIHQDHIRALDHIGFISEKNTFFTQYTARQNASLLGRFYTKFDQEVFENGLKQFNVSSGKCLCNMSRGELMKFQLAFAMAHHPDLYLLDEATAGMDPVIRIDFYKTIRTLLEEEKCSVIMSSHLEEDIYRQFDYIGRFEDGCFVEFGENQLM